MVPGVHRVEHGRLQGVEQRHAAQGGDHPGRDRGEQRHDGSREEPEQDVEQPGREPGDVAASVVGVGLGARGDPRGDGGEVERVGAPRREDRRRHGADAQQCTVVGRVARGVHHGEPRGVLARGGHDHERDGDPHDGVEGERGPGQHRGGEPQVQVHRRDGPGRPRDQHAQAQGEEHGVAGYEAPTHEVPDHEGPGRGRVLGDRRCHPQRERQQDPREYPCGDGFGYGGQERAEQPGRAQHETHDGGDHVGAHGVGELVVTEGRDEQRRPGDRPRDHDGLSADPAHDRAAHAGPDEHGPHPGRGLLFVQPTGAGGFEHHEQRPRVGDDHGDEPGHGRGGGPVPAEVVPRVGLVGGLGGAHGPPRVARTVE